MHLLENVLLFFIIFLTSLHGFASTSNDDYILTGKSYMTQRDFNHAVFFFSKAIDENPEHPKAYVYRSKAYLMLNRYPEAMKDYQKALAIDPKFVKDFWNKKRVDKNNSSFGTLLEIDPIPE